MLKYNNIMLSVKLFFPLAIAVLATIFVTLFSVESAMADRDKLIEDLNDELYQISSSLLNSDRDFYQALLAREDMEDSDTDQGFQDAKASYEENAGQVSDGIANARKIFEKNKDDYGEYRHDKTGKSFEELFKEFDSNYSDWRKYADANPKIIMNKAEFSYAFDSARDDINQMEEIIDVCSKDVIVESHASSTRLRLINIAFSTVANLIAIGLGIIILVGISRRTRVSLEYITKTSRLDLAHDPKFDKYKSEKDEFGLIMGAVAKLRREFRDLVGKVVSEMDELGTSIQLANKNMAELGTDINEISATTEELSAGMEETAASTQEVNATSSELENAASMIAAKAEECSKTADTIRKKADDLSVGFKKSYDNGVEIFNNVGDRLSKALEDSKTVQQINVLADAILQITSKTNLLSLNASIEAARAGEAGKGFAVVADEIRKLAEDSKNTVAQIQEVTVRVIESVDNLSSNANDLLEYVSINVKKDYGTMFEATEQYRSDAESISSLATDLSASSQQMLAGIHNIANAITDVTRAANEGAAGTENIAEKSSSVVTKSEEVLKSVNSTKTGAEALSEVVSRFNI